MVECLYKQNCNKVGCYQDFSSCKRKIKLDLLFDAIPLDNNQRIDIPLYCDNQTDSDAFNFLLHIQKSIVSQVTRGYNLYIYSEIPGNGKTSWALKLLRAYIYKIWPEANIECKALFINVPKYLLELKANISEPSDYIKHIKDNVLTADMVIWDDIGTKAATEFEHEHLLAMIDYRLNDKKCNIYTSNICPNNLSELLGSRLASRIINISDTVEFIGKDKRGGTTAR